MVTAIAHKDQLTHTYMNTCRLCLKPYSNSTSDFVSSPPASATLIHLSINWLNCNLYIKEQETADNYKNSNTKKEIQNLADRQWKA